MSSKNVCTICRFDATRKKKKFSFVGNGICVIPPLPVHSGSVAAKTACTYVSIVNWLNINSDTAVHTDDVKNV
ncbi:hypothetical protein XELAEV_18011479mg [Xenopus laevis]|uniref:Uncharacterized protein n=1 Tax=Xenopus laevis TaxID=8355 RepID=A0A974DKZ0_XENLA|nr:hypothetical protein XELAEV_18011479mg [Xenopus laevis]